MPDRVEFYNPLRQFGKSESERERAAFYNSDRWRKARLAHLARQPLCQECMRQGRVVEARIVHHIQERLDRPDLAFDRANLESLCSPCHTRGHARKRNEHGETE
jgi:5-methylcytosine-specific restriction enzyme A